MVPFGRKRHEEPVFNEVRVADGVRTNALIVETGDPIDDEVIPHGANVHDTATTRLLVDIGGGPILVVQELMLVPNRWPVPGMRIPITIEPSPPHAFEVDWDAIPSMEQRAAAGDPTLVDPIGTRRAISDALVAAGFPGIDMLQMPTDMAAATTTAQEQQLDLIEGNFAEKLTAAASLPAPAGKTRALVLIAASTVSFKRWQTGGQDDHLDLTTTRMGTHNVVLSVHTLGLAPYAVFIERFVHEKRAGDPLHPGLPALISTTDPHDVDVLWDEMETHREEFAVGRALGKASNRSARGLEKQMRERITDVLANATPPPVPSPGAASMPDRATLEQAGRTALQILTDPAQRQQIIDQYRTMGIELD